VLFGNLPDFLKIIILVVLVLTTNFQRLQYSKSASRLRCYPSITRIIYYCRQIAF